ncbi:hypothetical protein D3C80_1228130 [compost metagenome]
MGTQAVAEHAVQRAVVDLAGVGGAAVVAEHHAQVGAQGAGAQRLLGEQAEVVLAVDVVEVGEEVAAGQRLAELVVETGEIEVVAAHAAGKAPVLAVEEQVLGVGRGAVDHLVQTSADEGQAVDFLRGEQTALEHLWQQAAVAGLDHWQLGDVRAVAQLGGGDLDLGGQAQAAELVRGAAIVLHRQQVGAGAALARVELDAEHAQGVEADADAAVCVAGLEVKEETLAPLLALVLPRAFAEVAIQVDVGGGQGGAAVLDEAGVGQRGEGAGGDGQGQAADRRQGLPGGSRHRGISSHCCCRRQTCCRSGWTCPWPMLGSQAFAWLSG